VIEMADTDDANCGRVVPFGVADIAVETSM